jgi:hypothetical protein
MDDLDRVFHRLVSNIRHRHPEYLTLPFTVQELYETLIPYRHHRRELGIETNQDYEVAVTRLLSGERDYLQADQEMRDKLQTELSSLHADPGAFREFASAKVSLAPEALRRIRALTVPSGGTTIAGAPPTATPPAAAQGGPSIEGSQAAPTAPAAPAPETATQPAPSGTTAADESARPTTVAIPTLLNVPEGCPFCAGTLPEGRTVVYCPHCGNNLSVTRCPACGGELEKGWKFCISCGRSVT